MNDTKIHKINNIFNEFIYVLIEIIFLKREYISPYMKYSTF